MYMYLLWVNDLDKYRLVYVTGRYWEMVERLGVKQFYGAPTALRLLLKAGNQHVEKYDRSSLTTLGCGEYVSVTVKCGSILMTECII